MVSVQPVQGSHLPIVSHHRMGRSRQSWESKKYSGESWYRDSLMLRSWFLCALACSAAALSSAQVEHAKLSNGRQLEELDSPSGSSETPKCNRCGKDGPQDYNCCHPGGAWAGVCGDEGMIARGTANYTHAQGFVVSQERLKRFECRSLLSAVEA